MVVMDESGLTSSAMRLMFLSTPAVGLRDLTDGATTFSFFRGRRRRILGEGIGILSGPRRWFAIGSGRLRRSGLSWRICASARDLLLIDTGMFSIRLRWKIVGGCVRHWG